MNFVRMASGARGRGGPAREHGRWEHHNGTAHAEGVQVQTHVVLHNSNCKRKRCPMTQPGGTSRVLYGGRRGPEPRTEPRTKNRSLSVFAGTATSKNPTIIS